MQQTPLIALLIIPVSSSHLDQLDLKWYIMQNCVLCVVDITQAHPFS